MAEDSVGNIDDRFKTVTEGKAKVLFPKSNAVFYNPVQEFNRDLSIAVIKQFVIIKKKEYLEKKKGQVKINKKNDELQLAISKNVIPSTCAKPEESDDDGITVKINIKNEQANGSLLSSVDETMPDDQKREDELGLPNIKILEGLSATGLRAIRYALEIPGIHQIIANDLSRVAVENINRNINHNNLQELVQASNYDAGLLMYENRYPHSKRFQVIDLDPYGSPAQFLDASLQSVDDGGLLCITCTDMAGLCGNHGEASFANYGVMPLKTKYCHEMALRVVLSSMDCHAGRYKRYIVPVLSISVDFYIRVFVRVFTSASEVKRSASKKAYVFHCIGCDSFHLQPVGKRFEEGDRKKYNPGTGPIVGNVCVECGQQFQIGGPIWAEPIHDMDFVKDLLESVETEKECYQTNRRIKSVLTVVSEELAHSPLYYVMDKLCNILHCNVPSMLQFRSAVIQAGYKCSSTHANSTGIKTDAPSSVIWDILRCWTKHISFDKDKLKERSPGFAILSQTPKIEAKFDVIPEANPKSRQLGITRYPENPQPEWGPKARAKLSNTDDTQYDKRRRLQGKRFKGKKADFNYQDFPCKRFKQGECTYGDTCKYSHDIEMKKENRSRTDNVGEIERDNQNLHNETTS